MEKNDKYAVWVMCWPCMFPLLQDLHFTWPYWMRSPLHPCMFTTMSVKQGARKLAESGKEILLSVLTYMIYHISHITLSWQTTHMHTGVNKKHQKFIFEYWVFSQKSYLNMWCFENTIFVYLKFNICLPKLWNLHTQSIFRHTLIFWV